MASDAPATQSTALAAIEEFLTGRLESTQNASRAARASGTDPGGTGRELESLRARELSDWQERGFLSHLNAAAVIEEYYGHRIAQARRDLRRERPARKERYARARDTYRRIVAERQAVHLWLLDQGWDTNLNNAVTEEADGVAGHYWTRDPDRL
ncbi:hypothetical protein [Nocardiopsis sp. MG754419]|uniref:hypothetical protein n=1 Tax=Nocardiopsis sp. MG754419 TaxID=2259865 RepID=UPI001BABF98A|nr:hypothetical protein [Nocardiopsis sp. MG754419]MBR8744243.1 hypothetical protein [Nocardiopsis sp. MG754419]